MNKTTNSFSLINKIKKERQNMHKKIKYSFSFVSLVPPFVSKNTRLGLDTNLSDKKILIKQSYVLLSWFYYLSFLENTRNKKNRIKFSSLPSKMRKFTSVKAPMAHKNWSKEQYRIKYFNFRVTFCALLDEDLDLNTVNNVLMFTLLTKKNFPFFETNLLFLKNYSFFVFYRDPLFFNYHKFLHQRRFF